MVFDANELFDYMNCPLHHYFKSTKNIPDKAKDDNEKYKESIELVIKGFYYSLMDEKFLTPKELKIKWQAACNSLDYNIDGDNSIKALKALTEFHNWAQDNCGVAFDINRECLFNINSDDKVRYKLPIVRQKFDKTFDILHIKHWNSTIDMFRIETDLVFPLSILAFHNIYDRTPDTVTVFNCKTGKEITLRFTVDDLVRAQNTILNICNAVNSNIIYPRWNIYCNGCSYKPYCKSWKG